MAQRKSTGASLAIADIEQERADYRAAKRQTRLRPRPKGIPTNGAPADYHLRTDADHLWVGELGMEFDRNDLVAKRLLDVQETNVLQDGFQYDPQTGDKKLDKDLKAWWTEFSETPSSIDAQSQWGFNRITRFLYRGMKAAGDIWPILRSDGTIQVAEFYRVRGGTRKHAKKNIVLGVELDDARKREAAWFTNDVIPAMSTQAINWGNLKRIAVYQDDDPLGDEAARALQLFDPTRITATRGVSAFAPVFDFLGMHGDLQFTMLMKSQMANMVLLLRQRAQDFNPEYLANAPADGTSPALSSICRDLMAQELRPGLQLGSLPGETLSLASANVPNAEFFAHMRLVLALCGIAFYIPLVQLLLDASETNFSGYRGAISEARLAFKREQSDLVAQWHRPVMWFQLDRYAERDAAIGKVRDSSRFGRGKVNLYAHRWKCPRWAYIQPVEDATAALIRRANTLTSPRRQCTEDGVGDWEEIFVETVDDHFAALDYAYKRAAELIAMHKLDIEIDLLAARLLPLPNPERTQISVSSQIGQEATPAKPAPAKKNAPAKQ